ncbi:MAG TPA: DUF2470 domain-containing protein [Myxococcota bacterium]
MSQHHEAEAEPTTTTTTTTTTAPVDDPASLARRWLLENASGTLCTISTAHRLEGWPFGSIVPYALDEQGRPLVLIAEIAEHTRNAELDPRVSLFVSEPNRVGDPQSGWRLNVAGHLTRLRTANEKPHRDAAREAVVDDAEMQRLRARYIERVPAAISYAAEHDFYLWRLDIERVRNIAGFGRIHWVDGKDMLRDPVGEGVASSKAGAIDHMNADHATTMIEMATGLAGFTPATATMIDLDRTGMFVQTTGPDRLLHFSFGREIVAKDIRHVVVDVLKRARAKLKDAPV